MPPFFSFSFLGLYTLKNYEPLILFFYTTFRNFLLYGQFDVLYSLLIKFRRLHCIWSFLFVIWGLQLLLGSPQIGDVAVLDVSATKIDKDESNVQNIPAAESKGLPLCSSSCFFFFFSRHYYIWWCCNSYPEPCLESLYKGMTLTLVAQLLRF